MQFDKEILTQVNKALKAKKKIAIYNTVYQSYSFVRNDNKTYDIIYTTPSSIKKYQTKYLLISDIDKKDISKYKANIKAYSEFNIKRPPFKKNKKVI